MTTNISPKEISQQEISERRLSAVLGIFGGLLLAALISLLIPQIAERALASQEVAAIQIAPDFEMESFNSAAPIALSDYKGQGVVLNFWATWCHPCQEEMPALESAWQKYKDQGIVLVGVNSSDNEEQTLAFLEEYGVSYPNGSDLDSEVSQLYQIQGLPTTWFIAGDGSVAKIVYGPLDLEALDAAIALILPEAGG
jgi:peroxiredoxin